MNARPHPPLVSIYMPTKDRLGLLQQAVESVLRQTYPHIELIVTNDGSEDGTRAWLDELARRDARVRAIHHDRPTGAPQARNEAILSASGTWVTGLDDDDQFEPERIERFVAEAERLDAAGVRWSGLYSLETIESPTGSRVLPKPASVDIQDLFRFNHIGNQLFARRETFTAAGLFDPGMPAWQDLELFMRIVGKFGPAYLVSQPLYLLADDERPDRISKKKKQKIILAFERVASKWRERPGTDLQRLYLQALAPFYGFSIEREDLRTYFSFGASPTAWIALAGLIRRRQGRLRSM